jgi:hypothetical protein
VAFPLLLAPVAFVAQADPSLDIWGSLARIGIGSLVAIPWVIWQRATAKERDEAQAENRRLVAELITVERERTNRERQQADINDRAAERLAYAVEALQETTRAMGTVVERNRRHRGGEDNGDDR